MSVSDKFALQEVFKIAMFDLVTGENYGYATSLKESSLSSDATVVYSMGGVGNPKRVGFSHSKNANLKLAEAAFDMQMIGNITGSTPVTGTNTNLVIYDEITISSNSGTTEYTALGTAGAEIKYAYIVGTDGSFTTRLTQGSTPTSTVFKYVAGTKTITTSGVTDGATLAVFYNATAGASTKTINNYSDLFSKELKVVCFGRARDLCSGVDYGCQIIFYKAKISDTFGLTLTADGEPSTLAITVEALQSCTSTKLFEMIVYETGSVT